MPVIGCHNPQTWDKNSGVPFDSDTFKEIRDCKISYGFIKKNISIKC